MSIKTLENQLRKDAQALDTEDKLSASIGDFSLPEGCIYLDGNSLGPLPICAQIRAKEVTEQQWGEDLITSWNKHKWIDLPASVGAKIAPLIGAETKQVIACDSISVNLTKVLCAALQMTHGHLVLSQSENFPTDLYMVQGLSELLGEDKCRLQSVAEDDILNAIEQYGDKCAVLMLTHVNFRTGRILDMQGITQAAHEKGIIVIWDLAHSAGVLNIDLNACKVDFAVGCTYKYLNGGPGAPAFIYSAKAHLNKIRQPISGWMGHKRPFAFSHDYEAGEGMQSFLAGTPPVISMSVLDAALDVFTDVNKADIRAKSISLGDFFARCFDECLAPFIKGEEAEQASGGRTTIQQQAGFALVSPKQASERGSQVAYAHEHAYAICQAMIAKGVIADFRAPNILRIGFSPLFLSHKDMLNAVLIIQEIMQTQAYLEPQFQVKQAVT